jgi:hypothetical protein
VFPTSAGDETTGAVVAAAAEAEVAAVSEPEIAKSAAAPMVMIFLRVFELVMVIRKPMSRQSTGHF